MVERTQRIVNIVFQRLFTTLGLIFFVRIGTFFPVPGISQSELAFYLQTHSVARNLISTFSDEKNFVIGLFTLNIFPYINATILTQLLVGFLPSLSNLQKEGDLASRRSITQLTRLITLLWAIIQATAITFSLKPVLLHWTYGLAVEIVLWLTTGAMIVLWVSELITKYGLGNGSSLLIYTNIISNLPNLIQKIISETKEGFPIFSIVSLLLITLIALYGIVFLQEGTRKIPLLSSKQLTQKSFWNNMESNYYLPLRFNQAGVMPIILTTALLVIPNYLSQLGFFPTIRFPFDLQIFGVFYWISYFGFILFFSSYYSNFVLKPKDISENLQKMAVAIPGIKPGLFTTFYLKQTIQRLTLLGAILLALIVILPNWIFSKLSITSLNGLGTTSFLILAGVLLDMINQVKNIYYSNMYPTNY